MDIGQITLAVDGALAVETTRLKLSPLYSVYTSESIITEMLALCRNINQILALQHELEQMQGGHGPTP